MIKHHSSGTAPSIDELGFEIVSEIARCSSNPRLQKALRPLVIYLNVLRHFQQCGECDAQMKARARGALDELHVLLEPTRVEAPKPHKPKFRVFNGSASRVR